MAINYALDRSAVKKLEDRMHNLNADLEYYQQTGMISDILFGAYTYEMTRWIPVDKDEGELRGKLCRILSMFGINYQLLTNDFALLTTEEKGKGIVSASFQRGFTFTIPSRAQRGMILKELEVTMSPHRFEQAHTAASNFAAFAVTAFLAGVMSNLTMQAQLFVSTIPGLHTEFLVVGR